MPVAVRRILVPVDFSECSRTALGVAWEWAQMLGGTIDVLHVWTVPSFIPPGMTVMGLGPTEQSLLELIRTRTDDEMRKFVSEAEARGIAINAASSEPGVAAKAIVERAETGDYDLIAMGTHGRSGIEHALLGSVTERVVRRSHRPVLTVRG